MNASPIRTRRWTRAEYYRLDELGIFQPTERLELVGGQIVVKERQSPAHATAIRLAKEAFEALFGQRLAIRLACYPRPGDHVSPVAASSVRIAVSDLLP